MAGILVRGVWTPSGGSTTVIIPPIGGAAIAVGMSFIHKPGAGTHTYGIQAKLEDGTESTLPRSRRRVLVVEQIKK